MNKIDSTEVKAKIGLKEFPVISANIAYGVDTIGVGVKLATWYEPSNIFYNSLAYKTIKLSLGGKLIFDGYVQTPEPIYNDEQGNILSLQSYTYGYLLDRAIYTVAESNIGTDLSIKDFIEKVKSNIDKSLPIPFRFEYSAAVENIMQRQYTLANLYGKKYKEVFADVLQNLNIYYYSTPLNNKVEFVKFTSENVKGSFIQYDSIKQFVIGNPKAKFNFENLASRYIVVNNVINQAEPPQEIEDNRIIRLLEKQIDAKNKPDNNKEYAENAQLRDVASAITLELKLSTIYQNEKTKELWSPLMGIIVDIPELNLRKIKMLVRNVEFNLSDNGYIAKLTLQLPEEKKSLETLPFLQP